MTPHVAGTRKEELFLTCNDRTCCERYVVHPTGADVWRIASALRVEPQHFTQPLDADQDADEAFRLDDGRWYRMALTRLPDGATPCVFLMRLPDGAGRCGLGELRPGLCRTFPSVVVDGMLWVNGNACTCRTWTAADLDPEAEWRALDAEAQARGQYRQIVASWNDMIAVASDRPRQYADFCRFLLQAYSEIDRLAEPIPVPVSVS